MRRIAIQHAEGRSRPIPTGDQSEPQPRGAAPVRPGRAVDHAGAAERFLAAPSHARFHDQRLWDLREKRDREARAMPEWEELRTLASDIKAHTLDRLDHYLLQFEAAAIANGTTVHWARDGAEHNAIVEDILRDARATTLVKSKSMLTEECGFRDAMARAGIDVVETDLGERIQQLDGEDPSHVVVPAVHKLRSDVARLFARTLGTAPADDDPATLAEAQRRTTRPLILEAQAGMTGANFLVAETGAVVTCTNEGNADLSARVPAVHIVSAGIEKLVPRTADLGVFIRLLSRSALGSPITQYTSHFRGPRPGAAMHVILVDNGRARRLAQPDFRDALKCIRCGACMNTCPVYRRSGGLSYGATYPGPIGLVLDPALDRARYATLPFASTLNGSCTAVCPVKIDLHDQILRWRRVLAGEGRTSRTKRLAARAAAALLARPAAYRAALAAVGATLPHLPTLAPGGRALPVPARESFHSWHARTRGGTS